MASAIRGRLKGGQGMIFPSMTILILGLAIAAVLGLIDWYLWRPAPPRSYLFDSTRTWPLQVEDNAVDFRKVA
jgi:hypothetical protein